MMAVLKRSKWPEDPQVHFSLDFLKRFISLNEIIIHSIRCVCTYNISPNFFFASPVLSLNVGRILKIILTKQELHVYTLYIYFLSIVDVFCI